MTRISYVIHITGYVIAQPTCTCHAQSDPVFRILASIAYSQMIFHLISTKFLARSFTDC